MAQVEILHGDCLEILPTLEAESVDAVVTDPPYHLTTGKRGGSGAASLNPDSPAGRARVGTGFMGKAWDGGDVAFRPETWEAILRVAKPGAHLLAFGGTRTFHRLMVAIEDAGWEIRDTIMWIYGQGFTKSLDVSKAIDKANGSEKIVGTKPDRWTGKGQSLNFSTDRPQSTCKVTEPNSAAAAAWKGWGTALKPAWEPIIVARKPLAGTVAENVQQYGTGAINVDGCRIDGEDLASNRKTNREGEDSAERRYTEHGATNYAMKPGCRHNETGRWPANLIHDGSDEVTELFPMQSGGGFPKRRFSDKTRNTFGDFEGQECGPGIGASSGSAARFFYAAKANGKDRGNCDDRPLLGKATKANTHPTVKPLALMRYLLTLVSRDDHLILDPFLGSGTTALAAQQLGRRCIGIEVEPEYAAIAKERLAV